MERHSEDEKKEDNNEIDEEKEPTTVTQSGRESKWPRYLIEELGLASISWGLIGELRLISILSKELGLCHNNGIQQVIKLQDQLLEDLYQDDANNEEFCMLASSFIIDWPSIVEEK